jgi:hypothetical protein
MVVRYRPPFWLEHPVLIGYRFGKGDTHGGDLVS